MSWVEVEKGDSLPQGAILAGSTMSDGVLYIGRAGSEVGKYNVDNGTSQGRVHNLWLRNGYSAYEEGEILCCSPGKEAKWVRCSKGDPLPTGAFEAGHASADGVLYVGRISANGEVGKLNVSTGKRGGNCHNLWTREGGCRTSYDVLCFVPKEIEVTLQLKPVILNYGVGGYEKRRSKVITGCSNTTYDSKSVTDVHSKVNAKLNTIEFSGEGELNLNIKSCFSSTLQETYEERTEEREFMLYLDKPTFVYQTEVKVGDFYILHCGDPWVYSPVEFQRISWKIMV